MPLDFVLHLFVQVQVLLLLEVLEFVEFVDAVVGIATEYSSVELGVFLSQWIITLTMQVITFQM